MIRCSHCGKLAQAGATSCQSCGMPLTAVNNAVGMVGMGQAEPQQELPAWLESLRAHERPVASGSGGQPFTTAELVDENSMPSWMRQDQSRLSETGASDAFPAVAPGMNPMGQAASGNGNSLEASSLIDERSLPSWMRSAQEGGQPAAGQNFAANSLVQPDSLPAWMKNLAPETETSAQPVEERYGLPAQQAPMTPPSAGSARMAQTSQASYNEPAPPSAQGFLAHDLVDQQAVPNWLKSAQGSGQQGQSMSGPMGSGFAAGELVDQRALPNWMKNQQGQEKSDPVSAMGVPVSGSGQGTGMGEGIQSGVGMPASTLLDMSSMPSWMSEGAQSGAGANFTPGAQQPGGMAAGSLVDMNAMPAWLKNADNSQQSAHGGQTRADAMRVPSRPRGDLGAQGQSEAAANVFASMLGVSASTPLPQGQTQAQENNLRAVPGQQPQQQVQPGISNWQSQPQPMAPSTPQSWQLSNALPPLENRMGATPMSTPMLSPLPSPMPNSPLPSSQSGGMQSYPGYMGTSEASRTGMGSSALGVGGGNSGGAEGTKKKGIFDAIRNFFFS